jgi:hypothetical protein
VSISVEGLKHGYVISQIVLEISQIPGTRVCVSEGITRSGYEVTVYNEGRLAGKFGLFIKFSTKRASPWRYSFTLDHQTEIDILYKEYGEVFMVFVNKDDGAACMSHELLKQILDDNHEEVEWVAIKSKLRTQYSISGKDGKLDKKISRTDFPRSVGLYAASLVNALQPQTHTSKDNAIWKRLFGR